VSLVQIPTILKATGATLGLDRLLRFGEYRLIDDLRVAIFDWIKRQAFSLDELVWC